MLNKRQQLQQQQLIYGGGNSIPLIRGVRSELARHPEPPPGKRPAKPDTVTSSAQAPQRNISISHSPQRNSATTGPQKNNADSRNPSQKNPDSKGVHSSQQRAPPDSKGDAPKVGSKDVKGRPRRQRPPLYAPPVHHSEKHVPRNMITIDTAKARGNTDVVRLVARDLGWREVSDLVDVIFG